MDKGASGEAVTPRGIPAALKNLDLQDWLLLCGIGFWEIGAAVIWWPAALILAGVFCLGFAYLIERAKVKTAKNGTSQ